VEDDFGGEVAEGGFEGGGVADVAADVFDDEPMRAAVKRLGSVQGSSA
jgi:hypothetical protein